MPALREARRARVRKPPSSRIFMDFPLLARPADAGGWRAHLQLCFARRDAGTVLARRSHRGPLLVQKPLYPEGREVCEAILVHPPGGIAGGDVLSVDVEVSTAAHALITTPGASRWYRSAGAEAAQNVRLSVARGAALEWLPQETIVFDGARASLRTQVELEREAHFVGWEVVCFGRVASGERFRTGLLTQISEIRQGGVPLFGEYARVEGGSRVLEARSGLAGCPVSGVLLVAGRDLERPLRERLRALDAGADALAGVTSLPGVTVARYLGRSAQAARAYFVRAWSLLRPALLGRNAVPPRIWNC
jgi:urease accessory protein